MGWESGAVPPRWGLEWLFCVVCYKPAAPLELNLCSRALRFNVDAQPRAARTARMQARRDRRVGWSKG